jgi:hypothetical protein
VATFEVHCDKSESTEADEEYDEHYYPLPVMGEPKINLGESSSCFALERVRTYHEPADDGEGAAPTLFPVCDPPVAVNVGVLVLVIKVVTVPGDPVKPAAAQ